GESAWEELAVDHALGEAFDTAEAEARREFAQALADQTLVAGAERGEPVAYDHPIDARPVEQPAVAARIAHDRGIMAFAGDRKGRRVDGAEHVEVNEAVIERSDQCVRHRVGEPREIAIRPRRIDHDKVVRPLDRGNRVGKAGEFDCLVFIEPERRPARDAKVRRQPEVEPRLRGPGTAVLDVVGEALLPWVEGEGGGPLARGTKG